MPASAPPPSPPTSPDVLIRPATPEDDQRCQDIAVAAWTPIYASSRAALGEDIYTHLHPDGLASKARQIASAFAAHLDHILVACDPHTEEVLGFATFRLDHDRKVGEIGNNAVDPTRRGRGIGATLYQHVLERFRQEGMTVARVTTGLDDAHAPARTAYQKVGFQHATQSITYYQKL